MNLKHLRKTASTIIAIVMLMTTVFALASVPVSADAQYVKPFKAGKYYFKYDGINVCYSKYKNKGYKKTKVTEINFVTNGKVIVYLDTNSYKFKSYKISSRKTKTLKKLPRGDYESVGVNGKYILYNRVTNYETNASSVYAFNLKNKRTKLLKKNLRLYHLKNNYYFGESGKRRRVRVTPTELSAVRGAIYTVKDLKIKKVKNLGRINDWLVLDRQEDGTLLRNKELVYYSKNGGHKLYRIKSNGKSNTLLKSFDDKYIAELFWMSSIDLPDGFHPFATIVDKNKNAWDYNIRRGKMTVNKDYIGF